MLNNCILCESEAIAQMQNRKSWSVSISGQPLCAPHWRDIREEYAS